MASESSNANLTGLVDDDYFSTLAHGRSDADADELFPISDEKYAAELQLQEVIMSSFIAADTAQSSLPTRHTATNSSATPVVVTGECSSAGASSSSSSSNAAASTFDCKICLDAVPLSDALHASRGCEHAFCATCLAGYVDAKIQDRIADVMCPEVGCAGVLDPTLCQDMFPPEVFERWGFALCESMVLRAKKAYCPFKDCSAMMVVDDGDGADVTESECPSCSRPFCAQCGVPWHADADCAAYRKLGSGDKGKEDNMKLEELAKGKKWKKCPECNIFVEKVDGCLHITCK